MAFAAVHSLLLAKLLGADGRGALAFVMVVPSAMISLGSLGVRQAAAFRVGRDESGLRQLSGALFGASLLIVGVAVSVGLGAMRVAGADDYGVRVTVLAVSFAACRLLSTHAAAIPLGQERVSIVAGFNAIVEFLRVSLLIAFVGIADWGLQGALGAAVLAEAVVAVMYLVLCYGRMRIWPTFDWNTIGQLISHGGIYALAMLVFSLNYRADIWIVRHFLGDGPTGIYSLGVTLAEFLWVVPSALGLAVFARSTRTDDVQSMVRLSGRALRLSGIFTIVAVGLFLLVVGPVVSQIFGDEFHGAEMVAVAILPGVVSAVVFKILNTDLAGRGRPGIALAIFTPALLLNIVLNILFVPLWGMVGAAVASTISYASASTVFLVCYCRVSKVSVGELCRLRRSDFVGLGLPRVRRGP